MDFGNVHKAEAGEENRLPAEEGIAAYSKEVNQHQGFQLSGAIQVNYLDEYVIK